MRNKKTDVLGAVQASTVISFGLLIVLAVIIFIALVNQQKKQDQTIPESQVIQYTIQDDRYINEKRTLRVVVKGDLTQSQLQDVTDTVQAKECKEVQCRIIVIQTVK